MPYKKYECIICGYIYDEELGDPDDGLAPGTRWEDIPDEWVCPDCGVSKFDFELEIKIRHCQIDTALVIDFDVKFDVEFHDELPVESKL